MSEETKFVYVTYIHTTPEKLWDALTQPEFTKQYFFGVTLESTWKKDAPWKMVGADGKQIDSGEVLENDPPKRRVLRWRKEAFPEYGDTVCTMELEPDEKTKMVKLTLLHVSEKPSKLIEGVSNGWPKILSQLKTLLETGNVSAGEKLQPTCG